MLYKINDTDFINLRAVVAIQITASLTNGYYLSITPSNGIGFFSGDFSSYAEAEKEVSKINRLLEESVL